MTTHSSDNVKEIENGGDMEKSMSHEERLRNVLTNTMSVSPELFEQMYLQPKTQVKGELRKTFANPTPLAVLGFAVGLFPLSIEFMAWRGSGDLATPTTTVSIFFGGALLWIAGFGEFLLGNTFPMLVFFGYGAHFFTYATTFVPFYGALKFSSQGDPFTPTPTFTASFAFYPVAMGMLSFIYLLGSIRTNIFFVLIFTSATIGFSFAAASLWYTAAGDAEYGTTMLVATGACFFAADLFGWYIFASMMITTMELPIPGLPLFDLSTVVKAKSRIKEE